jgi:hypothetical protein
MSKKLTKEMIEELIKEELAKAEQERLDEFKVTINSKDKWNPDIKNKIGITNLSHVGGGPGSAAAARIRALAAKAGRSSDLEDADFDAAYSSGTSAEKSLAQGIHTNSTDPSIKAYTPPTSLGSWATTTAGKAIFPDPDASGVPKTRGGTYNKTQLATWLNNNVLKKSGLNQAIAQDYVAWIVNHYGSAVGAGRGVGKRLAALQRVSGGGAGGTGDTKKALAIIIKALNSDISIDDREFPDFLGPLARFDTDPGDVASTDPTGAVNTTKVKADSSVMAQFSVFGANATMEDILKQLEETAGYLENPSSIPPSINQFELLTKVSCLVQLGILGKMYDESSAGFALEKYCALLFGGVQVGADNGAADVYAILSGGQAAGLSQKFYNKPETISQATSGLNAYFATGQNALYYFVASKGSARAQSGQKEQYSTIYLYIIKLEHDRTAANNYKASFMKPATPGAALSEDTSYECGESGGYIKITKEHGTGRGGNDKSMPSSTNYAYKLPILKTADSDVVAVADYARDQLTGRSSPVRALTQAITNIQKRLQNMQYNTQEYAAEKGGSTATSLKNATDYIDALATDYTNMKKEYKDVFTAAPGGDLTYAQRKGIAEQKMKELDLMIENMVKQFLKGN